MSVWREDPGETPSSPPARLQPCSAEDRLGGAQSCFWAKARSTPWRGPSLARSCDRPEVLWALLWAEQAAATCFQLLGEGERCCPLVLSSSPETKGLPQSMSLRSSSLLLWEFPALWGGAWDGAGPQPPLPQGKTHHCRPEKWGVVDVPRGSGSFHAGGVVGSDVPLQACLTVWVSSWAGIPDPSAPCSPRFPGSSPLSSPEQHRAPLEHDGPFQSNCAKANPSKHCATQ